MEPKLSVIVPCFNVPNIHENITEIINKVIAITGCFEIIFINDGNSYFPTLAQSDYIKVITHETNKGKGEAIMSGFRAAKGDIICFIDADLQIPAALLKPYYKIMQGNRSPDILIGSKRHYNSKVDYPFKRRLYSYIYQSMTRLMFGLKLLDTQVGIKMFTKEVVEDILPLLSVKRFAIDLEMLVAANERGYSILEAPVQINESFSSTVNIKAVKQMIQDTFGIWFRKKFKKAYKKEKGELAKPMHLSVKGGKK